MTGRLRLTYLYVPGDRPDRVAKAVATGADVVIVDLEDAVAAGHKAKAREAVAELLRDPPAASLQVRVNGLDTPWWRDDLGTIASCGRPCAVRVPKVTSPEVVETVAAHVPAGTEIHCLIESALGVERAFEIASSPGVDSISLGEADLKSDLGISADEGLQWARGRVVVAARAAGLPAPAMSVYPHVRDEAGLESSTEAARAMGFVGRVAIHPAQLPVIERAFRPSEHEVAAATELLEAMAAAADRDDGVIVLPDGRFADRAMVDAARAVVALADRCGVRPSPS